MKQFGFELKKLTTKMNLVIFLELFYSGFIWVIPPISNLNIGLAVLPNIINWQQHMRVT